MEISADQTVEQKHTVRNEAQRLTLPYHRRLYQEDGQICMSDSEGMGLENEIHGHDRQNTHSMGRSVANTIANIASGPLLQTKSF